MPDRNFWKNRKVFITGHTGFKGAWLSLWLNMLGAKVLGYALQPPTSPSLYDLCTVEQFMKSTIADIRNLSELKKAMNAARPEIVIHMAAQPLVRDSYKLPLETYEINVMGTVNLFEAVRKCKSVRAVINVTTDKCYENRERRLGYREDEPLGGYDPYSSSKACSELVTSAYRSSFFNPSEYMKHRVAIASARAGNVIGGGDWAEDRLIPDCVRALLKGKKIDIRNPKAVRPWQHVLEPLSGYMLLAEKLYAKGSEFAGAWNFGPDDADAKPVEWVVKRFCKKWGRNAAYIPDRGKHPHEARYLKLDCSKANIELGWQPHWNIEQAIDSIVDWTRVYEQKGDLQHACCKQINAYMGLE